MMTRNGMHFTRVIRVITFVKGWFGKNKFLNISPTLDNVLNFVSSMCRECLCRQKGKLTKFFMASIV
jgi:hypothetical protein